MYVNNRIGLTGFLARYWKAELLIIFAICAVTVIYLELLHQYLQTSMLMVTGISTAFSFFIAFFTAQAYDRWWEARKIWGTFVNGSCSLYHSPSICDKEDFRRKRTSFGYTGHPTNNK